MSEMSSLLKEKEPHQCLTIWLTKMTFYPVHATKNSSGIRRGTRRKQLRAILRTSPTISHNWTN
jgi:hypothetical protein